MAILPGDQLGHYVISAQLGAGGMGEVYRATDTRLDREVAIKVLPDDLAGEPERLARFEREAKTLANVNHPNVAVLYGLERQEETGAMYLAMELVEGHDLAQEIARGPIPVGQTVEISVQIARGLDAAHTRGIIHRDLKPANIRVTPDGTVKILDFGLAKESGPAPGDTVFTESPTITADMTRAGTILGTAPYLSPEQAAGKTVDRRADIWAVGCVIFEMLTGQRAFPGSTSTEILACVLERDPDWEALPESVPSALRRLVERCLEKDPKRRLRDAADLAFALEDLGRDGPPRVDAGPGPSNRGLKIALGLVSVAAIVLAVLPWFDRRPAESTAAASPIRFTEPSSAELDIARIGHMDSAVAISPDGHAVVWVGFDGQKTLLFSRHLDESEARPVRGTEGALAPFFSPDSEWIGFWADGKIKKVALRGGAPQTICEADHIHGASWGDGFIILGLGAGGTLASVDLASGEIDQLAAWDDLNFLTSYPRVLPGSNSALVSGTDGKHVGLFDLETGEVSLLLDEGSNATYVSSGHLVWLWGDSLLAAPFDLESLTLTGNAQTVVDGVLTESGFASHYAVSDEGTLVYLPGTDLSGALRTSWLGLDGVTESIPLPADHSFLSPRVSLDGQKILVSRAAEHQSVILYDLERGTTTPVAKDEGSQYWAIWTPDSRSVIFNSLVGTELDLWIRPANLGQQPKRLTTTPGQLHVPMDITSDGRTVFVGVTDGLNGRLDLHLLHLDGDGTTQPLLELGGHVAQAKLSPDGRFLAYSSDNTGRFEVYVQTFPDLGAMVRVSPNGGQEPLWSPAGDRIYYRSLNGTRVYVAEILDRDPLRLGKEELLLESIMLPGIRWGRKWDIHPDGQRFLVFQIEGFEPPDGIRVVRNWFTELERLVPTR